MIANGNSFGNSQASTSHSNGGSYIAPGEGTPDGKMPPSASWMFTVTSTRGLR
jgi:hypothetical protein